MRRIDRSKTIRLLAGALLLALSGSGYQSTGGGRGAAAAEQGFDILLKGGHVIDPANGINGPLDVSVSRGRIVRVGENLPSRSARTVVNVDGYFVTPGLIDIHAYVDDQDVLAELQGSPQSVNPDHNALRAGVTTVVDAGSAGWGNFEAFRTNVVERSKTRILAFLNAQPFGHLPSDESPPDVERIVETARLHPGLIVGIRADGGFAGNGDCFGVALEAAEALKTRLLVDFNSSSIDPIVLSRLRRGDIVTGLFGEKASLFDRSGSPRLELREARARGVLLDVGHGSQGFRFRIAIPAIRGGFMADTISTAMDKEGLLLPRAEMMTTLSKFLNLGLSLEELVMKATATAAMAVGREDLGSLAVGSVADIAVLEVQEGSFAFVDSGRARWTAPRTLRAAMTIRNGIVVWDTDGLSTAAYVTERTYSNYQ